MKIRMFYCTLVRNIFLLIRGEHTVRHTSSAPPASSTPRLKQPCHIDEFVLYRMYNMTRVAVRGVSLMFRREIGISRRDWRSLAFVGQFPDLNLTRLAELTELDTVVASRCEAGQQPNGVSLHNPLVYRARIVGDWVISGRMPPCVWQVGSGAGTPAERGSAEARRGKCDGDRASRHGHHRVGDIRVSGHVRALVADPTRPAHMG
ncbi:monooxygenase [Burkholderia lata]|uniref:hypothetical protein n=1 Tax=Burkholderia lata (strain ATCC 17760 / DSM 23089 / LMG 22485 / NCIMB 9086 / R18194 / 383) TaxID=482957 RepID=UPI0014535756|nr:hypothetical protein [Burkholderia lata]VWD12757.1 monooxygenase [Burkholderia lata]